MLGQEEIKQLKLNFWRGFGAFCKAHPKLDGNKKPFVLHNTGISHVDLKFDIDRQHVRVALEVNHRNEERRLDVYEYVEAFKTMLERDLQNVTWNFAFTRENSQVVGRAYVEALNLDFFDEKAWNEIYTFMAENMIILQRNFFEIKETLKEQLHKS